MDQDQGFLVGEGIGAVDLLGDGPQDFAPGNEELELGVLVQVIDFRGTRQLRPELRAGNRLPGGRRGLRGPGGRFPAFLGLEALNQAIDGPPGGPGHLLQEGQLVVVGLAVRPEETRARRPVRLCSPRGSLISLN